MVTIWSFRNSIHPFSFEQILNGKYAVSSAPNVPGHVFVKYLYAIAVGITSLFSPAYFNAGSNENGVQQDTL